MITASEAIERLRTGNHRFVSGTGSGAAATDAARRAELTSGQSPFAVVLGCSDSRVPVEIVFDQGLGDLFVIRVAGNIAAPSQIESIEFATEGLGSRLVVVLGHTQCGAVQAAMQGLAQPVGSPPPGLPSILDHVQPALVELTETTRMRVQDLPVPDAVRANVRASVARLQRESQTLGRLVREEGLLVVGAEYALESGVVEFFDGVPRTKD